MFLSVGCGRIGPVSQPGPPVQSATLNGLATLEITTVCNPEANKALQGLTRGYELTMTGTTKDGRSARIVYSLSGYTKAVRTMNSECGNTKSMSWLIQ